MSRWMTDADALRSAGEKAGEYVQQNAGATPVIYAAVFGK
jgi:hypothetical protein